MNPGLLWSRASGTDVGAFAPWRDRVSALRPRYLRVLVDWSQLQPDPADRARPRPRPPTAASGACRRARATGGLAEVLRAARSQQRAGGGFEVVLVLYGVPDWAAVPAVRAASGPA